MIGAVGADAAQLDQGLGICKLGSDGANAITPEQNGLSRLRALNKLLQLDLRSKTALIDSFSDPQSF
jgi:hypothetical protein